jgi:hypothetical protein
MAVAGGVGDDGAARLVELVPEQGAVCRGGDRRGGGNRHRRNGDDGSDESLRRHCPTFFTRSIVQAGGRVIGNRQGLRPAYSNHLHK